MNKLLYAFSITLLVLLISQFGYSQCTNPTIQLPDASTPVNGNPATAYCTTFTFDPNLTGLPTGLQMQLQHTWQGDLSIFVRACNNTLMVMNRPGTTGSCGGGCPCGNNNDIGTPGSPVPISFSDGGGPDPENGIVQGGGSYGITADNSCGVSTVNTFAALWASCPPGPITATVCIADHAGADMGVAANVTLIYPNPVICGCTNPNSPNYNPNANVDDGSCIPGCSTLMVSASASSPSVCAGSTVSLSSNISGFPGPYTYTWAGADIGFLSNPSSANPTVTIPVGFSGVLSYILTVGAGQCQQNTSVSITVNAPAPPTINGPPGLCPNQNVMLSVSGAYSSYSWSSPPGGSGSSITVSQPGTYTVTVTDANGCPAVNSYTLPVLSAPIPQIVGPNTLCTGATALLDAGPGFSSYSWTPAGMSQTLTVSAPGTYTVTVTNAEGCTGITSITLTQNQAPNIGIFGGNQICPNSSLLLSAELGYSNLMWSNGASGPSVLITSPGIYEVTGTDANGCIATGSIVVSSPNIQAPVIVGDTELCPNETGTLSVSTSYTSYQWSTGQFGPASSVSLPGVYYVTVTTAEGCQLVASTEVVLSPNAVPFINSSGILCDGQSSLMTVFPTFASYSWSDGSSGSSLEVTTPGTYGVTVTNSDGCIGTDAVTLLPSPAPLPNITGPAQLCPGASAFLDAGFGFWSYQWSNSVNANGQQIAINAPGNYTVTVSNALGCFGSRTFTVAAAPLPTPVITGNLTLCAGSGTTLDAGAGYSSYIWSNGGNSRTRMINVPGTYTVTVTNSAGCRGSATVEVISAASLTPVISGNQLFCFGDSTVLSTGGSYYTYAWSNGETTPAIAAFTSGAYSVTVTNQEGCSGTANINIEVAPSPIPQISGPAQFCFGSTANLQAGAGYAGYQWSAPGGNDSTLMVAASGLYSVTVTDGNGCTGSDTLQINELPQIIPIISGNDNFCNSQGSTVLTASAGYASYQWSNMQSGQQISVAAGGNYTVTVTDTNGCTGIAAISVTAHTPPVAHITGALQYCQGASVTLAADAGFSSYAWSTNAASSGITVNAPGIYTVTVTDVNGCTAEASVTVVENPNPAPVISGLTQICTGGQTMLSVPAGFSSYLWSNAANAATITVNAPGDYTVTVTDVNGCMAQASVTVVENPNPTPLISGLTQICTGGQTMLSVPSGFSSYLWSNAASSTSITVNAAGAYSVTVTDTNGCTATASATVTAVPTPDVGITGSLQYCQGASVTLAAGAGFSSYAWSTNAVSADITVNAPGTYAVTVTDNNGCSAQTSVTVVENPNPTPVISGLTQICNGSQTLLSAPVGFSNYAWSNSTNNSSVTVNTPGAYSVTVTDANGCSGAASVTVTQVPQLLPAITGTLYYCAGGNTVLDAGPGYATYNWSNSGTGQQLTVSSPGSYTVSVTDANGCSGQATVSIIERPLPLPQITGPTQYCEGNSVALASNAAFSSYQWSTGASSQNINLSTPGVIGLTVTDAFGCVGVTSVNIIEHPLVQPNISGNLSFCQGQQTVLDAGTGFMTYQWSNAAATRNITVNSGGNYGITVTDANGCVTNGSVTVIEFPVTAPQISGDMEFCAGENVVLTATPGYTSYVWSNSNTGQTNTISLGGFFSVTATDANGCTSNNGVSVTRHPLPNVSIGGSASFCVGGFTTLNAGAGFVQYAWSNGSTGQTLQVNTPGVVSVTVTDSNGCSNSDNISITQDTELSPQISGPLQFCPGTQTTLDAGPGYATYQWSNSSGAQSITVTQTGTYTVSVTDAFGCAGSGSVQVSTYPQPQLVIEGTPSFCVGNSPVLSSSAPFASYLWSTGATQPQITVSLAGTYGLTVTDDNGCVASASQTVTTNPLPVFSINGDDFFCAGAATDLSVSGTFSGYLWTGGQQTQSISASAPGSYSVTVTNQFGCVSSQAIQVAQINLPISDAGPARELTCNNPAATLGGSGTSQGGGFSYLWSGPGITPANATLRQPQVNAPGAYQLVVTDVLYGCQSVQTSVNIADLTALPAISVAALDTLDCVTPSIVISGNGSATGANFAYQWLNAAGVVIPGANQLNYTAAQPGQYRLRVINTYSGCVSELPISVEQDIALPIAEAGTTRHLNCIITADALDGSSSTTGPGMAYLWTSVGGNIVSGSTGIAPVINSPGLYVLRVTNQRNGCASSDSVTVTQDIAVPTAVAGQDQEIDCLHPTAQINGTGSSTGAIMRYEWLRNGSTAVISNALALDVATPGTYTLRVVNTQNGCSAADLVIVAENPERPRAIQPVLDNPTCFGDTDGSILIGGVTGGTLPYLYSVNGSAFRAQTFYPNLGGGTYNIVVQDATGCELALEVSLPQGNDLALDLGPDQFINLGQRAQVQAQYNIPEEEVASFQWNALDSIPCDGCLQFEVRPFTTVSYSATLVDSNGCRITNDVTIFVANPREVFIPNAFSPNNDGTNDRLLVFAGEDVAYVRSFLVFNRWGESVFEVYNFPPNDPAFGWDGNYRAQLYNANVFAYFAEVEFIDGSVKLFKGDVTLMK